METVVWERSLGKFRFGTFAWELSLGNFRLGTFAWKLWLGNRLRTLAQEISFGNFRLGTLAPESQAGGTGLLRLGEPVGGYWGNPGAPTFLPALQDTE